MHFISVLLVSRFQIILVLGEADSLVTNSPTTAYVPTFMIRDSVRRQACLPAVSSVQACGRPAQPELTVGLTQCSVGFVALWKYFRDSFHSTYTLRHCALVGIADY